MIALPQAAMGKASTTTGNGRQDDADAVGTGGSDDLWWVYLSWLFS